MATTGYQFSGQPSRIPRPAKRYSTLPAITDSVPERDERQQDRMTLLEMEGEVRAELKRRWHCIRKDPNFCNNAKSCWTSERMALKLEDSMPPAELSPAQLEALCNKPTMLYWAYSGQRNDRCPLLPFGSILKEWFLYHNDEPNIEFGHFFASPVRITSTGPTTIAGILEAHRSLCDRASLLHGNISRGEAGKPQWTFWPDPQHFKLLPLCRAIMVVLDELAPDLSVNPDHSISVDEASQKQSVILVRTGDESCLSAPISFEGLSTQSRPLARSDITPSDNVDAIRVSLATAVAFIADLNRREEAAYPEARDRSAIDADLCPSISKPGGVALSADIWVDDVVRKAEEKGIDNVWEVSSAVERVEAARRGESFDDPKPYLFNSRWR